MLAIGYAASVAYDLRHWPLLTVCAVAGAGHLTGQIADRVQHDAAAAGRPILAGAALERRRRPGGQADSRS